MSKSNDDDNDSTSYIGKTEKRGESRKIKDNDEVLIIDEGDELIFIRDEDPALLEKLVQELSSIQTVIENLNKILGNWNYNVNPIKMTNIISQTKLVERQLILLIENESRNIF